MSMRKGGNDPSGLAYRQWSGAAQFEAGSFEGMSVTAGVLRLDAPSDVVAYEDPFQNATAARYEVGRWRSPVVETSAGFEELVASWNARTPPGTWIEVSVSVRPFGADPSCAPESFVLGRWAEQIATIHRTSVPGQASALARVECDVLIAQPGTRLGSWQLTVSAHRAVGSTASPTVSLAGAMTSAAVELAETTTGATERLVPTGGRVLAVPRYSQMVHRDRLPEFDNGGEAWCSPSSTAMVLGYWDRGPGQGELAWLGPDYPDPVVAHAAAGTFDYGYRGAGNWSFNAAYAACFGLVASVTRLGSLAHAEAFVAAGIPLVASVSFRREELSRAGYDTAGHLLVIAGFTASGDVVSHDPASHLLADNEEVPVVYDRDEFERVWLRGSGGLVYVIRPADVPLPPAPPGATPHW
jgi:hypothetical protein